MVRFADQPHVHGPQPQHSGLGIADQVLHVEEGASDVEDQTGQEGKSAEDEEEVARGNCETLFNNA